MTNEYQLRVLPQVAADAEKLRKYIAEEQGLAMGALKAVRILKRSIDARQRTIFVNLKVRAYVNELPTEDEFEQVDYQDVSSRPQVIVVGAGPGGLFAALRLVELGFRPIVLERGKDVHERKKDLANISRTQQVDGESNYCFGEGGAGAYSDGKLYTRSKKRGNTEKILRVFCQHGASTNILADAHPHIGTDRLPQVIEAMRNTIIRCGGEVHFQTKMTQLLLEGQKVIGCVAGEKEYLGPVILATGHSARDVYRYLNDARIHLETKGIAVGVRLEHPSQLIDQIQYHCKEGRGQWLPAAEYAFVTQADGRGVYSFCMCPGGHIVPAGSEAGSCVVNGMSASHRNSPYANSGMVVQINPEDIEGNDPLKGLLYQEELERLAFEHGGPNAVAPAQRMRDFVEGRASKDLPACSYLPGIVASRLDQWLPVHIGKRLQQGFRDFDKKYPGFLTNEAVIVGVESRSSSAVRIPRDPETLESISTPGLYPCGEGAGYAGGITSSALDGINAALAISKKFAEEAK